MSEKTRILGLWDSASIAVGIVVGVGIFRAPREVSQYLNEPFWMIFAWCLGGLVCLLGVCCYGELASLYPETGGTYVYLKRAFGRGTAFLYGWIELLVIRPGSIAAVSFIFSEAAAGLLPVRPPLKLIAAAGIAALFTVNLFGLRHGKRVQNAVVAAVLSILVAVIVSGFASQAGRPEYLFGRQRSFEFPRLQSLGLALIPILWTYGGWHENTFLGGETRNPAKVIPQALFLAIGIVIALYVLVNAVYLYLIPVEFIKGSRLVMSDAMFLLFGNKGRVFLNATVVLTSLASMNGTMITGSRLVAAFRRDYGAARMGLEEGPHEGTPKTALCLLAVLSVGMILVGTFEQLLFFTGVVVWLFFALTAAGLFVIRKRSPALGQLSRRAFLYPAAPALFLLVSLALFTNTVLTFPRQSAIGLGLLSLGAPAYLILKFFERKAKKGPHLQVG